MKELRRLCKNGNALSICISRRLLEHLRWRGGDGIVVELTERNTLELRPPTPADMRASITTMVLPDVDPVASR